MPQKCYICGSEDHVIAKCPKPPKDNEKRQRQVRFNEKGIVHATTEKITMTRRYTHLWHVCLAMANVQVKIMVTVRN